MLPHPLCHPSGKDLMQVVPESSPLPAIPLAQLEVNPAIGKDYKPPMVGGRLLLSRASIGCMRSAVPALHLESLIKTLT